MELERAINRPVTMYPADIEIVRKYAESNGMSFSLAVRHIVREWATLNKAGIYVSQLPHPDDATPVPIVYVTEEK